MLRSILTLAVVASLAGCAANNEYGSNDGDPNGNAGLAADDTSLPNSPTELAAYAGSTPYPVQQTAQDLRLAAIVSPDGKTIRLYNFTGQNLRDVRVWVNRSFVKPIGGIAKNSRVVIRSDELYNGLGHTLAGRNERAQHVQLQTLDALYNVMGPAVY